MKCTVFYSWQSDHPNSINRGFIQDALEKAATEIRKDGSIQVEPVIDRDTIGVPGSPDIAATIFAKIDKSQVFVCDVTIVNQKSPRQAPNPNVLIELGYAIRSMGPDRILMVMNTAFGGPELLPFDLRNKRVIVYKACQEDIEKAPERKLLQAKLREALTTVTLEISAAIDEPGSINRSGQQAIIALSNLQPNRSLLVRRYMDELMKKLLELAPDFSNDGERDELLIQALDRTVDLVAEFAQLSETAVSIPDIESINILYEKLEVILEHYRPPVGFSGTWYPADYDFFKFLGHELYVIFYSFFIRNDRFETLSELLEKGIYVKNTHRGEAQIVAIGEASDFVALLDHHNHRVKLNRACFHADMLKTRHSERPIRETVPFEQFIETDFFLFLREGLGWRPWSTIYLGSQAPRFLIRAANSKYAEMLFRPLRVQSIEDLRGLVVQRVPELRQLFRTSLGFSPLEYFKLNSIGSM